MKGHLLKFTFLIRCVFRKDIIWRRKVARILIVEDSNFIRSKIRDAVTQGGHTVVGEAENGVHAINMYAVIKPDIVTMDITMPILDGLETLKKIMKLDSDCNVIMVSAMGQQMIVVNAIKLGAKHFIVKPIIYPELLRVIDEVIEHKAAATKNKPSSFSSDTSEIKIHNITGTFIIDFPQPVSDKAMHKFITVVEGLLYIEPLKLVIDFKNIEYIDPAKLQEINNVIADVRNKGGEVTIYSQSNKFIDQLQTTRLPQLTMIKNKNTEQL
jgi:two-component system chemotaxis response regulator CheY